MVIASVTQGFFTASLIASHHFELLWAIYLAVAVAQFTGAIGRPSQGAMLPGIVRERDLPRANATFWLLSSTSVFVAPAIGAALLLRVGPDPLFAIDAGTFVVSALLIATLPARRPAAGETRVTVGGGHRAGAILLALRQPAIRMVAAANFTSGLVITVTQALLVVAAHERFGGDAAVGYLYSSVGVGGALGGVIALRWIPPRAWTRLAVFLAITVEVVAIAGFSASSVIITALLLLAVSAAAGSSFDTWGLTEIQRQAPPGFMGRFNSVIFISMYWGMLIGAVWALSTATVLRWDVAIELACATSLVLLAGVWISGGRANADSTTT
jgi:Transmembrane secretion effector